MRHESDQQEEASEGGVASAFWKPPGHARLGGPTGIPFPPQGQEELVCQRIPRARGPPDKKVWLLIVPPTRWDQKPRIMAQEASCWLYVFLRRCL